MRRIGTDREAGRRAFAVLLVGGLAYLLLVPAAAGATSVRTVLLRYALLAAGALAVAPPHVLFPDRKLALVQLLNLPPRALLRRQLGRWGAVAAAFLIPPVALAVQAPAAALVVRPLVEVGLVLLGVGAYAVGHYTGIGPVSLAWAAGRRGGWYHRMQTVAPQVRLAVPLGLIPSVLAAARVFAVGAAAVLATTALGPAWAWAPGAALLAWSMFRLARRSSHYDAAFYSTNALYDETLRGAGGRSSEREPIRHDAVYWAPRPLRPHVWAALVQLDRRLPLGRPVALGVVLLWVLFIQGVSAGVIGAYLLLVLAMKNAAVLKLTQEPLAPRAFGLWVEGVGGWTLTRFFANLRWTLPLAL
ncbi:MAG: hypothetical protein R3362_09540, partial [Rhodothermales bacterium]|nr:hypothetical protein [Rhodothermales bacterium]